MGRISIQSVLLSGLMLCCITQTRILQAQWFYSFYLEQEYNTNPFGFPQAEEDQISRFSLGLQKDWEKISAQYFGNYHTYYQNSERSFYWQQFYMGGGDSTSWSLLAENRSNHPDYNVYNYLSVRAGINHTQLIKNFIWRTGGGITLNNFLELPDLNNMLFTVYTSLQRSFITRTSFIGSAALNYKYYLREITAADTVSQFLSSINQLYQGGGSGPGQGGPGGGGGYNVYVHADEQRGLAQLLLTLRVAQSVSPYTGLAVQYQTRLNFSEYDRSISSLLPGYISESQIFDDPLGYGSQMWGIELTQLLPWQITMKAAGYYQEKNYLTQGSYLDDINFDQTLLRHDFFRTVWGTMEKRFSLWESNLALQLNYQWIDNSSNSYWYDYKSKFISLGMQVDL